MEKQLEDDGSLEFLKIPTDPTNRHFNCPEITQQKLTNLTFWICDYIDDVKTKFGEGRTIVKIKFNKEDKDCDAKKFFTNSREKKICVGKSERTKCFSTESNNAGIRNKILFG